MSTNLLSQLELALRQSADASETESDLYFRLKKTLRGYKNPDWIRESASFGDFARDFTQPSSANHPASFAFIPSGYEDFDQHYGGFLPGEFSVIAGRPAMGKSGLLISLAIQMNTEYPVLFLSLEQNKLMMMMRITSLFTGVEYMKLITRNLSTEDEALLAKHEPDLQKLNIRVNDSAFRSIDAVEELVKEEVKTRGVKIVMIDPLQSLFDGWKTEHRSQELGHICRRLHGLAHNLGIVILCTSQLSRMPEMRGGAKRPFLCDLRDSGIIEQECDRVMMLYRPEYYAIREDEEGFDTRGTAEWIIAKNRLGHVGTCMLSYQGSPQRFLPFKGHKKTIDLNEDRIRELLEDNDSPF